MNRISPFNAEEQPPFIVDRKKGEEYYAFIFARTYESIGKTLQTFGRFAEDPSLSFSWGDAKELSDRVRKKCEGLIAQRKQSSGEFGPPEGY